MTHGGLSGRMDPGKVPADLAADLAADLPADEKEWLAVRRFLQENRFQLGVQAAEDYPGQLRFCGTPLLTRRAWLPDSPVSLSEIELEFAREATPARSSRAYGAALPARYENYTDVYQKLAAPRVFENRGTYRLADADLRTRPGRLRFGCGRYFDSVNTGEASAHAYAAQRLGRDPGSIRLTIGDPCDLARRPANLAVSALTIRHDFSTGDADFFLHWRDPAKVGHAGGLFQVVPSGVFQASGEGAWNHDNDFSLVRFLTREFAEELGGRSEEYDNSVRGIDYAQWPFARRLRECLEAGDARLWCLGLGVDPLTFATDLLAVAVFESSAFAQLFGEVAADNDEGRVLAAKPFTESQVRHLVKHERMQAAGAALLAGAWQHRRVLLR